MSATPAQYDRACLSRHGEPTTTATARDQYEAETFTRLRRVKGLVRRTVAENDALRLGDGGAFLAQPRRDFDFPTDAAKQAGFRQWFRNALDDEFLEPANDRAVLAGRHWSGSYVRVASRKGINFANDELRKAGITDLQPAEDVFNLPVHQRQLEQLYLRNFEELQGVTNEIERDVTRTLTEAFAEGVGPEDAARRLNKRVDVGQTSARRTARSEFMNAHNTQAATRYQEMGVEQVEILTYQPCDRCKALAANDPYPVEQAATLVPVHPNCVCSIAPVVT